MRNLIAALIGTGFALGAAPAFAGEWRLDARRCADIREDWRDARESRRDERYDHGRRDRAEDRYDRRESRRDRAITVCPRSAFYYARSDWRDGDRRGEHRYGRDNDRTPELKLSYDRRLRMRYTYDHGRRIYIRG